MHLFDHAGRLQQYGSANDILRAFVNERLPLYEDRRQYLQRALTEGTKLYSFFLIAKNQKSKQNKTKQTKTITPFFNH